jgi:hypothetical protein
MKESESMSTILSDAKNFYNDFYDRGTWNDEMAKKTLYGKKDINKRKECLREIYKIIMDNPDVSDGIKYWVKTNHSIQETANLMFITLSKLKSQIYYFNSTIGNDLTYDEKNIIIYCLYTENINDNAWKEINKKIETVKIKNCKKMYKKESLLNNKNILVNIPRKEYSNHVSDEKFSSFLNLIRPYFVNERKIVQQRINESYLNEAGYLNYLMTPGVSLSQTDKERLAKIKKLLDEDTLEQYSEMSRTKIEDISKVKEEAEHIVEEQSKKQIQREPEEFEDFTIKTKHMQFR